VATSAVDVLRKNGVVVRSTPDANRVDRRDVAIQTIGGYVRRLTPQGPAFKVASRFVILTQRRTTELPVLVDGFEAGCVWDTNSTSNPGTRRPLKDGFCDHPPEHPRHDLAAGLQPVADVPLLLQQPAQPVGQHGDMGPLEQPSVCRRDGDHPAEDRQLPVDFAVGHIGHARALMLDALLPPVHDVGADGRGLGGDHPPAAQERPQALVVAPGGRVGGSTLRLAARKTNRQMEEELFISLQTVKNYASRIYRKLEVRNRLELMNAYRRISEQARAGSDRGQETVDGRR